ncbi:Hypothetical predicted protein, partial [Paramuricea clavata]
EYLGLRSEVRMRMSEEPCPQMRVTNLVLSTEKPCQSSDEKPCLLKSRTFFSEVKNLTSEVRNFVLSSELRNLVLISECEEPFPQKWGTLLSDVRKLVLRCPQVRNLVLKIEEPCPSKVRSLVLNCEEPSPKVRNLDLSIKNLVLDCEEPCPQLTNYFVRIKNHVLDIEEPCPSKIRNLVLDSEEHCPQKRRILSSEMRKLVLRIEVRNLVFRSECEESCSQMRETLFSEVRNLLFRSEVRNLVLSSEEPCPRKRGALSSELRKVVLSIEVCSK